jgi:hypothetical protein
MGGGATASYEVLAGSTLSGIGDVKAGSAGASPNSDFFFGSASAVSFSDVNGGAG